MILVRIVSSFPKLKYSILFRTGFTDLRLANGTFAFTHFIPGIQARVLTPNDMSEVGSWRGVSAVATNGKYRLGFRNISLSLSFSFLSDSTMLVQVEGERLVE
jgi:hypothetical protein